MATEITDCANCTHLVRKVNGQPYEHVRNNLTDPFCATPAPVESTDDTE